MILTKDRIDGGNNYVSFSESLPEGGLRHIIDMAEILIETYCAVTNSYLPFDPHQGGELKLKHDIQLLAREFFLWSAHISQCRLDGNDVSLLIDLYLPVTPAEHRVYQAALDGLRHDMVETAAFLGTQLLLVCANGNQLVIEGI